MTELGFFILDRLLQAQLNKLVIHGLRNPIVLIRSRRSHVRISLQEKRTKSRKKKKALSRTVSTGNVITSDSISRPDTVIIPPSNSNDVASQRDVGRGP